MRLEPIAGKLARWVLRGGSGSNVTLLPDKTNDLHLKLATLPSKIETHEREKGFIAYYLNKSIYEVYSIFSLPKFCRILRLIDGTN